METLREKDNGLEVKRGKEKKEVRKKREGGRESRDVSEKKKSVKEEEERME